jgi:AraC family transcriptional regulator
MARTSRKESHDRATSVGRRHMSTAGRFVADLGPTRGQRDTVKDIAPGTVLAGCDGVTPLDRILFEADSITVGTFSCTPFDPRFRDSGPTSHFCFVFPRTAVVIQHEGGSAFLADPTIVTFYNRGQVYARRPVSPAGDRCDWFGVARDLLRDTLRRYDPAAAVDELRLLRFTHGPSRPETYFRQRALVSELAGGEIVEALRVEESVLDLLDDVVGASYGGIAAVQTAAALAPARREELVQAARALLQVRLGDALTLTGLAQALDTSPYHLCRTFRASTGTTLHAYRNELRLRASLERLAEPGIDITNVALDLGYSSHSHFTAAFRRAFGQTPSAARRALRRSPLAYARDRRATSRRR